MATKTKSSKRKKSTQTYTCLDLFEGDVYNSGYNIGLNYQENTPVRIAILQGQYSSTFVVNRRREGISKNGTPWKKWEVWGQVIMSTRALNKAGVKKLNVYGKYRMKEGGPSTWFPFRNITSYPQMIETIVKPAYMTAVNREIERLMTENIGVPEINLDKYVAITRQSHPDMSYLERDELNKLFIPPHLYPMHLAYPITRTMSKGIERLPSGMTQHLRHETMMDVTRSMYGKKLYRKDLVKAVSEASLSQVSFAFAFKGIIPIDWIINLLNNRGGAFPEGLPVEHHANMKSLFRALTIHQQKRFLNALMSSQPKDKATAWEVIDTLRMFKRLNENYNANYAPGQLEGKTWKELHDNFTADFRRRGVADQPIEKVKLAKQIENLTLSDGYTIVQPKTTHELIDWGVKMEHCIGSYVKEAVDGHSVFLGIVKDKTMIGNAQISVREKRLVQIFGKRNRNLDKQTLELFSSVLIDNKVLAETAFKHAYGYKV